MSFKHKVADFLMVAADGYDTMSAKEVTLWYVAAIPANVMYYKLIQQRRFIPAIGIASMMVGALLARSFTLGLRRRRDFWSEVLREHQARWEAENGGPPTNVKLS
jgi:hypothetical protein